MNAPEFCTLRQVVQATRLDYQTVWRHKKKGLLKHEPTEGTKSLRFRLTQVERWLNRYFPERARDAKNRLHSPEEVHPDLGDKSRLCQQGSLPTGDICSGPVRADTRTGPCVLSEKHNKQMNTLITFNFGPCAVRTITQDGRPWFIAKDACYVLGLRNISEALRGLDDDEKITISNPDGNPRAGIPHKMAAVSESGLYGLIFKSRKAEAKLFRRWVTNEVLPAIRQTGMYIAPGVDLGVGLNTLVKILLENAHRLPLGMLKMILPTGNYGHIAKNGKPKVGVRSAAYVAKPDRQKDALRLAQLSTQLELFELLQNFTEEARLT